jgi:Ca2+-binding RTX toxin-like protein
VDVDLLFPNFAGQKIENITAIAGAVDHLFGGNDLKNTLTGAEGKDTLFGDAGDDMLIGNDGDDTLQGDGGADTMTGGKGNDIYIVFDATDKVVETLSAAAGGGTDTVQSDVNFSLATLANIENLSLTGGANHDSFGTNAVNGTGNALVNVLQGNNGDNVLDGGAGIDSFIGNAGNDTFVLDNLAEFGKITESTGSDTIKSALNFTEANAVANVENYTYTGSAAFKFDASGLTGVNHALTGGSGADTLTGANKDDRLDGGTGIDHLFGGSGNDIYVVGNLGDVVDEQGNADIGDAVIINRSVNLLIDFAGDIESATLTGTTAIDATGNLAGNLLIGNDGNNKLSGLDGTDVLVGGKGDDTLTGGVGADNFEYNALTDRGTGKDVITDFSAGQGDKLDIGDLLTGLGTNLANAENDGFLAFVDDGKGNTIVMVDADGSAGAVKSFVTLVTVQNVADPNDVALNTI